MFNHNKLFWRVLMLTNFQSNNQIISLEDIEEYLRFIAEIVLKPSRYLLKKLNSLNSGNIDDVNKMKYQANHDELLNKYNELKGEFNNNKVKLYLEMDSLADSLKENDIFYDEYFNFCEIKDMTKDTFDRDFSLIKNDDFDFILDLVVNFSNLINYKINLINTDMFNEREFGLEYDDYLTSFNKSKTYYYENICDESIDDDLFVEYTNIIMG